MDIGIGLVAGLLVGALIGFFLVRIFIQKQNQSKLDEINAKADLEIKEARLTAKRIVSESENLV